MTTTSIISCVSPIRGYYPARKRDQKIPNIDWGAVLSEVVISSEISSDFTVNYIEKVIEDARWCIFRIRVVSSPYSRLILRWGIEDGTTHQMLKVSVRRSQLRALLGIGSDYYQISYEDFQNILWVIAFSDIV